MPMAIAIALVAMVFAPPVLAVDECGPAAPALICDASSAYANGINYFAENLELTLKAGSVVDTSGLTNLPSALVTTVGLGTGLEQSTVAVVGMGDLKVTVESGASVTTTQYRSTALRLTDLTGALNGVIRNGGALTTRGMDSPTIYVLLKGSVDIENTGTIEVAGDRSTDAPAGISLNAMVGGSGDVRVVNSGGIIAGGAGTNGIALLLQHSLNLTVENNGSITAPSGTGISVVAPTGGSPGSLTNSGSITVGGTGVSTLGFAGTFTNTGTITSDFSGVIMNEGVVPSVITAVNDGDIIAGLQGFRLAASNGSLLNRGIIAGPGLAAVNVIGNNNTLILDTGSDLQGMAMAAGTGNAVELRGIGSEEAQFQGFNRLRMAGTNWTLSGDSTFNTAAFIDSGELRLHGNVLTSPAVSVAGGGALAGFGTFAGAVSVADAGVLSAQQGAPLLFSALALSAGSVVQAALGSPGNSAGLFQVTGNLVLDGRLDVSDLGGFGSGVYRIFDYGGSLTDNGLDVGALPGAETGQIQTAVAGQVNLAATLPAAGPLAFWDGGGAPADGIIAGGDGTWDAVNTHWTDVDGAFNGAWTQDFGVFQTAPGVVTIDNGSGQVATTGLQFASDGYRVTGGPLRLDAPETIIRVGTGAAAGADMTAILDSVLFGSGNLIKRDFGRLVLTGDSSAYAGASEVREGLLEVNGQLGGTLSVQSGATLAGSGTVGSTTLAAGAMLAPGGNRGAGIGALTINGEFIGQGGTVLLDTELAGDGGLTDLLRITGNSSGQAGLHVRNANGAGAQTRDGIRVVEVGGSSNATFDLMGRAVAGQYEYFLFKGDRSGAGGDWYLRSELPDTGGPTDPTDPTDPPLPVLRPEPGAYLANQSAAVDMFQLRYQDRHGDASTQSDRNGGWMRVKRNQADFGAVGRQLEVNSDSNVLQIGADLVGRGQDGRFTAGVMLASGTAQSQVASRLTGYTAKGRVRGTALGVYGTWAQNADGAGAYVDGWAQYGRYDNRVDGIGLRRESYDARTSTASLEAGYTLALGDGSRTAWALQPQLQVLYTDYRSDSVAEANGTRIDGADASGLSTRVGLQLQGHAVGAWNRVQPFLAVNWLHDASDNALHFDGETLQAGIPKDRYEVKAGAQLQLGASWAAWGDMAVQNGSEGYRDVAGQIGLRRVW